MNRSVITSTSDSKTASLRLKVRMTNREFEELRLRAGQNQCERSSGRRGDHHEIGRLILQECLDGKFEARIVQHGTQLMTTLTRNFGTTALESASE
ncbi:hypothetical protein Scep_025261 [Stephania cephalantha]|uniref:Uncharacterized protein n=1 Tax=Stephania cephalantha TaxID=152367 RepID=A0AAP0HR30_9MAGN